MTEDTGSTSPAKPVHPAALLTVADVAARLQLSTKTVRRMISRGDLPVHRLGQQLRVARLDLLGYVAGRRGVVSM